MSREARDWAWEAVKRLDVPPMARIVLLRIAERADARGTVRALRQTIAEDVGMVDASGKATTALDRALGQLRKANALTSRGNATANGDQGANTWQLPIATPFPREGSPSDCGRPLPQIGGTDPSLDPPSIEVARPAPSAHDDDRQADMDDPEAPSLFDDTPDLAPEPDAAKVHQREVRQRPKVGAPLVVATYIEEYEKAHGRPPLQTVRSKIGREAKSKLAHGVVTEAVLLEAVTALAQTEWENLDLEVKKVLQSQAARNRSNGTNEGEWRRDGWSQREQTPEEIEASIEAGKQRIRDSLAQRASGQAS